MLIAGFAGGSEPAYAQVETLSSPSDIVIAVDESGSITADEMRQEQQAATLVALGELNPASRVEVIGFGGQDSQATSANPQNEFDLVCPLTPVDSAADRQSLETCIKDLHVRTNAQGNNTNFLAVISQATADLSAAGGGAATAKDLFLLTDGRLDIDGSNSDDIANTNARTQLLNQVVPAAAAAGIGIWGLGFGSASDIDLLKQISAGSAQNHCSNLPRATPNSIQIDSASSLEAQLPSLFSGARCDVTTPPTGGSIVGPSTHSYTVVVPLLAAVSNFEAVRVDPRVQVVFLDPDGRAAPPSGSDDRSTFQLGGADGPVESLRVTDPKPGPWTVQFTAPAGVTEQVAASVLWQGSIKSDLNVAPNQPRPGDTVGVTVQIEVRDAPPPTADDLPGVTVHFTLSGAGFPTPAPIELHPDTSQGFGIYTGTVAVPKEATGALQFAADVDGPGLTSDTQTQHGLVQSADRYLQAQLAFHKSSAAPGDDVPVDLQYDNETGSEQQLHLLLDGTAPGVSVTPATVPVPASAGSQIVHLTLHFPRGMAEGRPVGSLNVVNQATGFEVSTPILVTLKPPPSFVTRYRWPIAVGIAVLLAALILWVLRLLGDIRSRDMSEIELALHDRGQESHLSAPPHAGRSVRFVIDRSSSPWASLDHDHVGGGYMARRSADGGLTVTTPEGGTVAVPAGLQVEIGDDELRLGFIDHRAEAADEPDDPGFSEPRRARRWIRSGRSPEDVLEPEPEDHHLI